MNEIRKEDWGSASWNEAHFPVEKLDTEGDTWGFRWRGREKWRHDVYLKLLDGMLKKNEPQTVLDVGCALCDFTAKAWAVNTSNRFSGMDISSIAIEWCQKTFPEFDLRVGAIPDVPFEGPFDIILCQEVLCYLDADGRKACLRNIRDKLVPGGVVMLSGVLDGGVKHHTTAEMLSLVQDGYKIDKVVYNHWSAYSRFIEEPLNHLQSKFTMVSEWLAYNNDEFENWKTEKGNGTKVKIAGAMRAVSPVSKLLVDGGAWLTRFLASRTSPAAFFHGIAKLTRDNEEASEIVVFATKI